MLSRLSVLLALLCVLGGASAQSAASPHEALRFFEGTWTVEGAPPEQDFRETCRWMTGGRRHMVCVSRWNATDGAREGMSIFSYDAVQGRYQYHGFRSGGAVVVHQGQAEADGWRFSSEQGEGEARVRTRVTITGRPEGFLLVAESARGDGEWRRTSEVRYLRLGP